MDAVFEYVLSLFVALPKFVQVIFLLVAGAIALSSPVASVINGWERGLREAGMDVPRALRIAQILVNPIASNFDKAAEAYKRLRAALPGGKP